jgi:hypothetical protein
MHGDESYKGMAIAKTLLPKLANAGSEPNLAEIVANLEDEEELRALLGFNLFDGVTWFNKERFDETALLAAIFSSVSRGTGGRDTDAPDVKARALVQARCALSLIEAAAEAGYRLDGLKTELMAISANVPGSAEVKAKPASAKKKPAKKTERKTVKSGAKSAAAKKIPINKATVKKTSPKKVPAKKAPIKRAQSKKTTGDKK